MILFNVVVLGSSILNAPTKVNVNTYLRSIDKIDDYKMVNIQFVSCSYCKVILTAGVQCPANIQTGLVGSQTVILQSRWADQVSHNDGS